MSTPHLSPSPIPSSKRGAEHVVRTKERNVPRASRSERRNKPRTKPSGSPAREKRKASGKEKEKEREPEREKKEDKDKKTNSTMNETPIRLKGETETYYPDLNLVTDSTHATPQPPQPISDIVHVSAPLLPKNTPISHPIPYGYADDQGYMVTYSEEDPSVSKPRATGNSATDVFSANSTPMSANSVSPLITPGSITTTSPVNTAMLSSEGSVSDMSEVGMDTLKSHVDMSSVLSPRFNNTVVNDMPLLLSREHPDVYDMSGDTIIPRHGGGRARSPITSVIQNSSTFNQVKRQNMIESANPGSTEEFQSQIAAASPP
jgi:hypothetical protein